MILLGDAAEWLKEFNGGCVSLTVTSPPYDNLKKYGGYVFNFQVIAKQLYRIMKKGGVLVWIVNDQTMNGDKTTTSLKQVLSFKQIGFKLHDTMIYHKTNSKPSFIKNDPRYQQAFEFMYIFSKGKTKTFNPIMDKLNGYSGTRKPFGIRSNIWTYDNHFRELSHDQIAYEHPAIFPEQLAQDHIKSWSNEGDLVLDPFAGSGTTLKAAHQLRRKWIGIEINPDYVQLAKKRLTPYLQQQRLEQFLQ